MEKYQEENSADQKRAYYWDKVRKCCERYKNFSWPSAELILNLAYARDVIRTLIITVPAQFKLSDSAVNILLILYFGENKGYKQQELSNLLLVSRANMTKVIDHMEKRGLVVRNASQEDRRARFIKLTAEGKTLANRIIPMQNEECIRASAGLSKHEINTLNKLLSKLSMRIVESRKAK